MIALTNLDDLFDLIDAAIREGYPLSYEVKQDIAYFITEQKYKEKL
jgi:hypothetical protein